MDDSFQIPTARESLSQAASVPRQDIRSSVVDRHEPITLAHPPAAGSGRLLGLLACLAIVAVAPYLIGHIIYQVRFNELKAGADVATDALAGLKPRLGDFELASRMVAKRLAPSVVSIFHAGLMGHDDQGSGVIVDPAGYIVTNNHVIKDAETIQVQLSDGRHATATIAGADEMTDLAVLKINLPNLIAAEWGDSDQLEVGDLVWALGSPFGLERSITFGIVSAKSRHSGSWFRSSPYQEYVHSPYQEYLQTDAAVNPGNSGGPLINIQGQVVGINAAIIGAAYQGISFAIPSNVAKEEYSQLRAKGWIERAWLGILPLQVPDKIQERLGLEIGQGVYVARVEPKAPAERAGIRQGDVILKWNDFVATDPTLLSREIASTKIGSTARVRLVRAELPDGIHDSVREELELSVQVERHRDSVPGPGAEQ